MTTEGDNRKREGMDRAAKAEPTWTDLARAAVRHLAAKGCEFTSEDVTALVGLPRGGVGLHRNNAVGAIMSAEARAGVIERVRYDTSKRAISHSHVSTVWVGTQHHVTL
jgi:hypothetical protein